MQGTSTRKQILIIDPDASLATRLLYDTYGSLIEVTIACNSLAGLTLVDLLRKSDRIYVE
jgi:hypothetical protein